MNQLQVFAVPKSLAQVGRQGRMEGGEDDIHTAMLAFAAHAWMCPRSQLAGGAGSGQAARSAALQTN